MGRIIQPKVRSTFQAAIGDISKMSAFAKMEQQFQKFVVIDEVSKVSQVKVSLVDKSMQVKKKINAWLPVSQLLPEIHARFGALRPGMAAMLTHTGLNREESGWVSVIGESIDEIIQKKELKNDIASGPALSISGGMIPGVAGVSDAGTQEQRKTIKVDEKSQSGLKISPEGSYLMGSKSSYVTANKQGIVMAGNAITLGTLGENIRQGGVFTQMNDFVRMIPQTLATPIPTQIPFPPVGLIAAVLFDLPFFLAMMTSGENK